MSCIKCTKFLYFNFLKELYTTTLLRLTSSLYSLIFGTAFELTIIDMNNKIVQIKKIALFLIIGLNLLSPLVSANSFKTLKGQVLDASNNQIIGATVLLLESNKVVKGVATDDEGQFQFFYKKSNLLKIQVKALGFVSKIIEINDKGDFTIKLDEAVINIKPISVTSSKNKSIELEVISQKQFEQRSKNSIITNNPINALKQPQMLKQGFCLIIKTENQWDSPIILLS